jgi:lysophospholipase L1-like esterase
MIRVPFDVVHFNNGMHGWGYTEEEYARYFGELLAAIRAGAPHAKLVWASTTPVRKEQPGGATNSRIEARNAIAARMIGPSIPVDDQYSLMKGHGDLHSDDVHFNSEGSTVQGTQLADIIVGVLPPASK